MIVGTRGSKLAVEQTKQVIKQLIKYNPNLDIEMKIISTKGDEDEVTPLNQMESNGIFTSALEEALLSGAIDIAVHSTKDVPSKISNELELLPVGIREDARDVLILKSCYKRIEDLPRYATIGTGSMRRAFQLQAMYKDWKIVPIRGNLNTRLKKLEKEPFDAIVLAAAGLKRLGLEHLISHCFSLDKLIPAPCQGILGVEVCKKNTQLMQMITTLIDPITHMQFRAERALMKEIGGSCQVPLGAYCVIERGHLRLKGLLGDEDYLVISEISGPIGSEEEMGIELAQMLKRRLMILKKVKISITTNK